MPTARCDTERKEGRMEGRKEEETKKERKTKNDESGRDVETLHQEAQGTEGILRNNRGGQKGTCPRGRRTLCFQIVGSVQPLERSWVAWDISTVHAPSIVFRHLLPWRKGVVNQRLEFEHGHQTNTGKTSYLCDCLQLYTPSRTLRSASDTLSTSEFRALDSHSEHRFPAPSSKGRMSYTSAWSLSTVHAPSIAFRHLPPNSARTVYATEGTLFISAQLSTDTVRTL